MQEYKEYLTILKHYMEHAQTIRFNAPAWRVITVDVDMRLCTEADGGPDIGPSLPRPETDPLFRGRAERTPGGELEPDSSAVEALATCRPTVEGVRSFLYRYGPLYGPGEDGSFAVLLARFVSVQQQFRYTWDRALGLLARDKAYRRIERDLGLRPEAWRQVGVSGVIEYRPTGLVHTTESLYAALVYKLFALARAKKLRRCGRPRCTGRTYFIASHPKDRYCSDECKKWAQAKAKRSWWEKTGDGWRKNRAAKANRKTGGKKSKRKEG
jgi:hypothetical protein